MDISVGDPDARQAALAKTLRAVRLHRGLGVSEMAAAMQMPRRSYQHFEAGRNRLNIDHLFQFAQATRSDPIALLAAVVLGAPELAVRCADNKMMSIILMNVDGFNGRAGHEIAKLKANALIKVFGDAFATLTAEAQRADPTADWIAERLSGRTQQPLDPEAEN